MCLILLLQQPPPLAVCCLSHPPLSACQPRTSSAIALCATLPMHSTRALRRQQCPKPCFPHPTSCIQWACSIWVKNQKWETAFAYWIPAKCSSKSQRVLLQFTHCLASLNTDVYARVGICWDPFAGRHEMVLCCLKQEILGTSPPTHQDYDTLCRYICSMNSDIFPDIAWRIFWQALVL